MAKTLRDTAPTSAVARLLNRDAASRALEPITTSPPESALNQHQHNLQDAASALGNDAPRIKREFILTDQTEVTFCEVLELFRRTTRTRLTASQLFRAMLKALRRGLPALQYEAHQLGALRLPGNGRQAGARRDAFEERIADAIISGMRAVGAIQAAVDESAQTRDRPGR